MSKDFDIIDGILYVDKRLFSDAMHQENNISRLTGSCCTDLFAARPRYTTGVESVIIDYSEADPIHIHKDPIVFVEELNMEFHNKVRGHITIADEHSNNKELLISSY